MRFGVAIAGALIGLVAGGPGGAAIGLVIGFFVDYLNNQDDSESRKQQQDNYQGSTGVPRNATDLLASWLLVLVAAMMNADGSAMKSELEMVRRMLIRTYGEQKAQQYLLQLR